MRAIRKRITEASHERIAYFGAALWACRGIRRNLRLHKTVPAFRDMKGASRRKRFGVHESDRVDTGERRAFGFQARDKLLSHLSIAMDANQHAFRIVADIPGETETGRETMNGRAKSNALHKAANTDLRRRRYGCIDRHCACFQTNTRLLPESAMTS
jgi:hypothetical protein